jgi:hypothetical protein
MNGFGSTAAELVVPHGAVIDKGLGLLKDHGAFPLRRNGKVKSWGKISAVATPALSQVLPGGVFGNGAFFGSALDVAYGDDGAVHLLVGAPRLTRGDAAFGFGTNNRGGAFLCGSGFAGARRLRGGGPREPVGGGPREPGEEEPGEPVEEESREPDEEEAGARDL